jgi:hypothetical protein
VPAPKKIPVAAWAAARYEPPPSAWLLRKWCRNGELWPPAEKVGKEWYVREDARRLSVAHSDDAAAAAGLSLVERLQRREHERGRG